MNQKKIEEEINLLQKKIKEYDFAYFVKDQPEISDELYDGLKKQLFNLQKKTIILSSEKNHEDAFSPLAPLFEDNFSLRKHQWPLYSLDNIFTPLECEKFIKRLKKFLKLSAESTLEFWVEPKLDGLCVNLGYCQGLFSYALTRGDGQKGEDVTQNMIPFVPYELNYTSNKNIPHLLEVRGEVVVSQENFQKMNLKRIQNQKTPFASPRHAAAGSLRQISPEETWTCSLQFIAHSCHFLSE